MVTPINTGMGTALGGAGRGNNPAFGNAKPMPRGGLLQGNMQPGVTGVPAGMPAPGGAGVAGGPAPMPRIGQPQTGGPGPTFPGNPSGDSGFSLQPGQMPGAPRGPTPINYGPGGGMTPGSPGAFGGSTPIAPQQRGAIATALSGTGIMPSGPRRGL